MKKCLPAVVVVLIVSMCLCFTFYNTCNNPDIAAIQGTQRCNLARQSSLVSSSRELQPSVNDSLRESDVHQVTLSQQRSNGSLPYSSQIQSHDGVLTRPTSTELERAAVDSRPEPAQHPVSQTYQSHTPTNVTAPRSWTAVTNPSAAPSYSPSPSSGSVGRTFIITHSFGGQLTRAVKNMMIQQCWAQGLPNTATILEPFSSESLLLHTPEIWDSVRRGRMKNAARFSDFFDLKLYNHVSVMDGGVPLVMWEEFLLRAPRGVVVVPTPPASCSLIANHHLQTVIDRDFKAFLKGLEMLSFNIVKVFPINCYDQNRGKKLIEMMSPFLLNSTIAFSSWRNYNVDRTWLDLDTRCNVSDKYPADRLLPSPKMKLHMQYYRTNILGAEKTIAIMLRVERFLYLKQRSSNRFMDETVDSCLNKTLSLFLHLKQEPVWADSQPFLTLDIGKYGSGIMQSNDTVAKFGESLEAVTRSVSALLVKVYNGRWRSISEWEDSFVDATEGITERGYVAMLQRGIAVQSDCLILMGGGSFQEVAANQYLQAHPDPAQQCLHTVCAATAIPTSLEKSQWKNEAPHKVKQRYHKN